MIEHRKHILPLLIIILALSITFLVSEQSSNTMAAATITPSIHKEFNTVAYASGRELTMTKFMDNIHTDPLFMSGITILTPAIKLPSSYDTKHDDSLTKYVSKKQSLNNIQYKPSDLVLVRSKYLTTNKAGHKLRSQAHEQLNLMAKEFYDIFDKKLVVVSAYRSYDYQKSMNKKGCADTLCAPAGHSEHQLGLAVDLFAATTSEQFLSKADFARYHKWLAANAHRYGRHNTYQKGIEIDGYQSEPRHWRYLGRELATELYDKKVTFGERVKTNSNKVGT